MLAARCSFAARLACHGLAARPCTGWQHTHPAVRSSSSSSAALPAWFSSRVAACAAPTGEPSLDGRASSAPQPPSPEHDERFMQLALELAEAAAAADEVPVGAVLVSAEGEVLGAARNATESSADPTAHAEMLCVRQAAAKAGAWRLLDATLYVTLEPCPMCAGALLQARVGAVVYGARNTLLGADGSWIAMLPQAGRDEASGSSASSSSSSSSNSSSTSGAADSCCSTSAEQPEGTAAASQEAAKPARPHPFHPHMAVRRGVLADECAAVMKAFFARRRKEAAAAKQAGGMGA